MIHTGRDSAPVGALARRWPVIAGTAVVVGVGALLWSLLAPDAHRATAQLFLTRTFLDASLTGTPNATAQTDLATTASTQATIAALPSVVERTLRRVGRPADQKAVASFLSSASTELPAAAPGMVSFKVDADDERQAVRLANAWARESNAHRIELDTRAIKAALRDVEERLGTLESAGDARSELYRSLVDKQQQLTTVLTLQAQSGTLVREALSASSTRRGPVASAILGTLAGAILGIALAFAWELLVPRHTSAAPIPATRARTERREKVLR